MAAITPNARNAAARARMLADVLTDNASSLGCRKTLRLIIDSLRIIATAFETEEPMVMDGIAITNAIPFDAFYALENARTAAKKYQRLAFLSDVLDHILTPVGRHAPELAPSNTPDDGDYTVRIEAAVKRLNAATDNTARYGEFVHLVTFYRARTAA